MAIALHHSKATGTAKIVMLGIANHDGDGGAWPSLDTLARYANVTRRNARKAIMTLVSLGEIEVAVQAGGDWSIADSHRPNLYHVLLKCPPDCDRSSQHRTRRRRSIDAELADLFESEGVALSTGGSVATPGRSRPPGMESTRGGGSVATPKPSQNPPSRLHDGTHGSARARECPVSVRISPSGLHDFTPGGVCVNCGAEHRERVSA